MAAFEFNARSLRSFFNGKFLIAVVIFYTCSHLIHVELITDEHNNAESYPDADQHLVLQKPTQTVVNADGSASLSASENSRSQATGVGGGVVGRGGGATTAMGATNNANPNAADLKPMVVVGGSVNGKYVSAKELQAAQDAMNGIQPTVEGVDRTSMSDGMRMMLCGDPPNVATLIKAHYCESKVDPNALNGLQGIPLRPFLLPTNAAAAAAAAASNEPVAGAGGGRGGGAVSFGGGVVGYQAHRRLQQQQQQQQRDFNSVGDGTGVDDTDGEDEAGATAAAAATDAAEGESFAEVVSKVNRGLAPVPGSGQVFVHRDNAMLFGRGLAADADADQTLIPPSEAAALDGHLYQTCSVVGSSGILRKTAYGAMIDSADAVFRINQAPTIGGCALFTGGRTTVRVINAHWLHKYSHGDQLRRLPVAANATLVVTRYEKGDYTRLVELWRRYRPDVKIRLLTRDTMHGATLLLHSYQAAPIVYSRFTP